MCSRDELAHLATSARRRSPGHGLGRGAVRVDARGRVHRRRTAARAGAVPCWRRPARYGEQILLGHATRDARCPASPRSRRRAPRRSCGRAATTWCAGAPRSCCRCRSGVGAVGAAGDWCEEPAEMRYLRFSGGPPGRLPPRQPPPPRAPRAAPPQPRRRVRRLIRLDARDHRLHRHRLPFAAPESPRACPPTAPGSPRPPCPWRSRRSARRASPRRRPSSATCESVPSAIDSPIWGMMTSIACHGSPSLVNVDRRLPLCQQPPDQDAGQDHDPDQRTAPAVRAPSYTPGKPSRPAHIR